jgi:hypothetical protein
MKVGKDGWLTLEPELDMSAKARAAYEAMKDAYAAYRATEEYKRYVALQVEYETEMQATSPEGKALVFGYRFGKASIKYVEASERKAKPASKPQVSLAEYLAAQAANGHAG